MRCCVCPTRRRARPGRVPLRVAFEGVDAGLLSSLSTRICHSEHSEESPACKRKDETLHCVQSDNWFMTDGLSQTTQPPRVVFEACVSPGAGLDGGTGGLSAAALAACAAAVPALVAALVAASAASVSTSASN